MIGILWGGWTIEELRQHFESLEHVRQIGNWLIWRVFVRCIVLLLV